jgi:Cilia- and flagella-associated protein 298
MVIDSPWCTQCFLRYVLHDVQQTIHNMSQAVDQETQKAMMAWYHKRQEQQKHLEENQDDNYLESSWSSGKSLKAHFSGVSNVRMPF